MRRIEGVRGLKWMATGMGLWRRGFVPVLIEMASFNLLISVSV